MTDKQQAFHDYIKSGRFTSYAQACKDFKWASKNSVHKMIRSLQKQGYEIKLLYTIKRK